MVHLSNFKRLWHLSKVLQNEIYLSSQLMMAGANKEKVLEKYKENINSLKTAVLLQKIFSSLFLLMLTIIPIMGIEKIANSSVFSVKELQSVIFEATIAFSTYYLTIFVLILAFGLLSLIELMKGDVFKPLTALPLSSKEIQYLVIFVFIRMHFLQTMTIILGLPVIIIILMRNMLLSFSVLLVNILATVFILYSIILLSHLIGKAFTAKVSKLSTLFRIGIVVTYMLIIFNLYTFFQSIYFLLQSIFMLVGNGSQLELLNVSLSLLIPFPFSISSLIAIIAIITLNHSQIIPLLNLLSPFAGTLLLLLIIVIISRKGNSILRQLAQPERKVMLADSANSYKSFTSNDKEMVIINVNRPIVAYMKYTLASASRDYSSLFSLMFPIVFSLILVFGNLTLTNDSDFDPFIMLYFYVGTFPLVLRNGLFSSEENIGGILSSLPYHQRELFRSKQILMIIIGNIPVLLVFLFQKLLSKEVVVINAFTLVLLNVIVPSLYLVLFSLFFGKVNNNYTLFECNITHKVIKTVLLIIIPLVIIVLNLSVLMFFETYGEIVIFGDVLFNDLIAVIAMNLTIYVLLEIIIRKMFR